MARTGGTKINNNILSPKTACTESLIMKSLMNPQLKLLCPLRSSGHVVQSVYLLYTGTLCKVSYHISLYRNHLSRDQ